MPSPCHLAYPADIDTHEHTQSGAATCVSSHALYS